MNLFGFLSDEYPSIPLEVLWNGLDAGRRRKAMALFEAGHIPVEGRFFEPPNKGTLDNCLEDILEIAREEWIDAVKENWFEGYVSGQKLKLINEQHGHQIVDLHVKNNDALREFLEAEPEAATIEDYSRLFREKHGSKIDPKVFAYAAAALASGKARATARALTKYLLSQTDLWPDGQLSERNLKSHMATFLTEFNRLLEGE